MIGSVNVQPNYQVGTTLLGRYKIVSINTRGGFGSVAICFDEKLKRRVAIKSIPLTDSMGVILSKAMPEALAEARTASFLSHPSIVPVLDFEHEAHFAHIIMEYVDGYNLADLIDMQGPLMFDEAAHVLEHVASALSYAHDNGVLHLDIKPDNIIINHSGNVVLTDFGMANLASAAGYLGARGGTTGYMPPEQLEGQTVDERTDVFALSALMYELLTGVTPFKALSPEASLPLILKGTKAPSSYDEELSYAADDAILDSLSPYPDMRAQSIKEFAKNLLPELGKAKEGKQSLIDLISDIDEKLSLPDQNLEEELEVQEKHFMFFPSIPQLFPRAASVTAKCIQTTVFGFFAYLLSSNWHIASSDIITSILTICFGLLGFFVPALAYALSAVLLIVASWIIGAPLMGMLIGALLLLSWLIHVDTRAHEGPVIFSPALLAPLSFTTFVPFLSGLICTPQRAVIVSALSGLMVMALSALTGSNSMLFCNLQTYPSGSFAPQDNFFTLVLKPSTWIIFASWIISAAAIAQFSSGFRQKRVIIGALLGFIINYVFGLLAQAVEIGIFSFILSPEHTIALNLSSILFLCSYLLFGFINSDENTEE